MASKIAASVPWKNITKEGKQLAVAVATKTDKWNRTGQGPAVETAPIKDENLLTPGPAKVVSRDNEHPGSNDQQLHFTVHCYGSKGEFLRAIRVPVKK